MMTLVMSLLFLSSFLDYSYLNGIILILTILLLKFSKIKNHFLAMLISLEFISSLAFILLMSTTLISNFSSLLIFSFMVMMVGEACLGLGLLIFLARLKSKELEVSNLMI